jgi:putative tryptophan/tyrosine transport system substrate-binding protein
MTGVAALQHELVAKRIELLHELVPKAAVVAVLVNPTNSYTESETRAAHDGARSLGLQLHFLRASTVSDINAVFGTLTNSEPARFSSAPTCSFSIGANNSSH